MIFRLAEGLFTSDLARNVDLITLLRSAALRGHTLLVVADPYGSSYAPSKVFEQWAASLSSPLQREMTWLFERFCRIPSTAVTRGATTIAVKEPQASAESTKHIVLDVPEAVRLAALPLFVLVENALSDAAFIRRTMPLAWQRKIREWERAGAIRFEHAGGIGEMKRIVEHCSVNGSADPLGLGPEAWCCSHVLLSDRDSQDHSGKPSREAADLQRTCARAGMANQLHMLRRRDQESYLPSEALNAVVATKTDKKDRTDMLNMLAAHSAIGPGRHHMPLPKIGDASWFKNAFLLHESSFIWEGAWFSQDGSGGEMVDLAEMLAAFI